MDPTAYKKQSNMDVDSLHDSGIEHDIMRAPRRKRKQCDDHGRQRRVVKMLWDDEEQSSDEQEMGESLLSNEDSSEGGLEPADSNMHVIIAEPSQPAQMQDSGTTDLENEDLLFRLHYQCGPVGQKTDIGGCDYTDLLSDEVLISVLKWLPKTTLIRCVRVCKRWSRLSTDESLWRRMDFANKTLKPGVLGHILNRGVAVLRLTKSTINMPLYSENMLSSPQLTRVQYLDLSMATVDTSCLEHLLSQCQLLRKLSLENCPINDAICRFIGRNQNMEVLNLAMCQGLDENGLVPLCNNLKRLDSLNVSWTNMSRGAVLYMVICLSASITKLNLSGCRETLLDEDIQQLCGSCPHLKELDLSDATLLTASSVEHVVRGLPGLEYIALNRCYHVAATSLLYLSHIQSLLALDVFGMLRESALYQLRSAMPNIQINKFPFSSIARPTTGIRRTSIWGLRVRDSPY